MNFLLAKVCHCVSACLPLKIQWSSGLSFRKRNFIRIGVQYFQINFWFKLFFYSHLSENTVKEQLLSCGRLAETPSIIWHFLELFLQLFGFWCSGSEFALKKKYSSHPDRETPNFHFSFRLKAATVIQSRTRFSNSNVKQQAALKSVLKNRFCRHTSPTCCLCYWMGNACFWNHFLTCGMETVRGTIL